MASANRLSNLEFAKAVESAVQTAAERNKLGDLRRAVGSDIHQMPWWIVGRQVREADLRQAQQFAEAVTAEVGERSGFDVVPALSVINGDILVGFVERFGNDVPVPGRFGGQQQLF
ncbi:MAG TPA: hypothetical protein VGC84_06165 [Ilumatobacteraceae bacterium]|jgi:hypothetical protein